MVSKLPCFVEPLGCFWSGWRPSCNGDHLCCCSVMKFQFLEELPFTYTKGWLSFVCIQFFG